MPPQDAAGTANAASLEGRLSIFDSIGSSLESLVESVKAIPKAAKEAAYYTYYVAKPAAALAGMYFLGGTKTLINACIMAGGFIAGKLLGKLKNKEKIFAKETYKQLSNEATIGAIAGGLLHGAYKGVHYVGNGIGNLYGGIAGKLAKAGLALGTIPPFMITHEYLNRALIREYKARPWRERKKEIAKTMAILGLPIMANLSIVPPQYNMPVAAGITTAYGFMRAEPEKKEEKKVAPEQTAPAQPYTAPGPG